MDVEKKDFGRWWMWVLLLLIVTGITFGVLNSLGIVGRTFVERKVFEQSYQRSESIKTEIATFEAQLAEINRKLLSNVDEQTRANMESQTSSIRILLSVARGKQ